MIKDAIIKNSKLLLIDLPNKYVLASMKWRNMALVCMKLKFFTEKIFFSINKATTDSNKYIEENKVR